MIELPIFQVDAFTGRVFAGNPAAVCLLESWLDDGVLQSIAAENNLSETAFLVRASEEATFALRWFTPVAEVDLCGHATLAAAFVLFERADVGGEVRFDTASGRLTVRRQPESLLAMDFPAWPAQRCEPPAALIDGLGAKPSEVRASEDYLAVYEDEDEVGGLDPDMEALAGLDRRGVIVSAPGSDADFVSRYFAPALGIPEDPVTGSAHCTLAPYWAARLGKTRLRAVQISRRGGELSCEVEDGRVTISGRAVLYLSGRIFVPG